jgi:hypothetical protein
MLMNSPPRLTSSRIAAPDKTDHLHDHELPALPWDSRAPAGLRLSGAWLAVMVGAEDVDQEVKSPWSLFWGRPDQDYIGDTGSSSDLTSTRSLSSPNSVDLNQTAPSFSYVQPFHTQEFI